MSQEAQQLIITPDNYSMVSDAVRQALSQDLSPAFLSLTDSLHPLKKGDVHNFLRVDADGDLIFGDGAILRKHVIQPRLAITCSEERVKALAAEYRNGEVRKLNGLMDTFNQGNEFGMGDIVEWKPGMRDANLTKQGQLAIVMETPGYVPLSTVGRDDLILGIKSNDGALVRLHADSRRFQLVAKASDSQGE